MMGIKGTYVGMPSQIAVQPFSINYPKLTGRYYNSSTQTAAFAAIGPGPNILMAMPFILAKQTSFDKIAFYIATPEVGGHARLGIYSNNSTSMYPTDKLLASNEFLTSVPGLVEDAISITLNAGIYWLVGVFDSVATLEIDMWGYSTPNLIGDDGALGGPQSGWNVAFAYGVLPASFPLGGLGDITGAWIFLRVA